MFKAKVLLPYRLKTLPVLARSLLFLTVTALLLCLQGMPPGPVSASAIETFSITYNLNTGGRPPSASFNASSIQIEQSIPAGTNIVETNSYLVNTGVGAPARSGWVFMGWSRDSGSLGSLGTVTEDTILYAIWETAYRITFSPGTQGTFTQEVYNLSYGSPMPTLQQPVTGNDGYVFAGWLPDFNETTVVSARTFTAQWTIDPSKIPVGLTYDGGSGATNVPPSGTYGFGDTVVVGAAPTNPGYSFLGWKAEAQLRTVTGRVGPAYDSGIYVALISEEDLSKIFRATMVKSDPSGIGTFTFYDVPDGYYLMYMYRDGYLPFYTIVTISGDNTELYAKPLRLADKGITDISAPGALDLLDQIYQNVLLANFNDGVFALVAGDLNGDYIVNEKDLSAIRAVVDNPAAYNYLRDVNNDGVINNEDIAIIRFFLGSYTTIYQEIQDLYGNNYPDDCLIIPRRVVDKLSWILRNTPLTPSNYMAELTPNISTDFVSGTIYQPGDSFVIPGNVTLTAIWEQNPPPPPTTETPPPTTRTPRPTVVPTTLTTVPTTTLVIETTPTTRTTAVVTTSLIVTTTQTTTTTQVTQVIPIPSITTTTGTASTTPSATPSVTPSATTAAAPPVETRQGGDIPPATSQWALVNLILCVLGALLSVIVAVWALINLEKARLRWLLTAAVLAVVGIVVFLLTEDIRNPMTMVDVWTIVNALVFALGLISLGLTMRRRRMGATDRDTAAYGMPVSSSGNLRRLEY